MFCPSKSIMIFSRHNIQFNNNFISKLNDKVTEKIHYYHTNYMEQQKQNNFLIHIKNNNAKNYKQNKITQIPKYQPYKARKSQLFRTHFRHLQIMKTQLVKTLTYWLLRNAQSQFDFYQTQAAFYILAMQTIRFNYIQYINQTLYSVNKRQYTVLQQQQIQNLKKYIQYSALPDTSKLIPYTYNCLQNLSYRRFAPQLMPRNIHQIWFSKDNISQVRLHLRKTLQQANPTFTMYLWTLDNVTKENFPILYYIIERVFQYDKTSGQSFKAMAADLTRYQAVYNLGGLYVDFKFQGMKPAHGFLRYETLFTDIEHNENRFYSGLSLGNPIMGAMQNSYHMHILICELINSVNIRFGYGQTYIETGSYVIRRAFNNEQIFKNIGLGYQLVFPMPYDNPVNLCGSSSNFNSNLQFSSDQTVYTLTTAYQTKDAIKIGIPCKQYPQNIFVNYSPLARTWIGEKRNVGR